MIPGFTLIEDGSNGANQTSYVTGSITPTANRTLYLMVFAETPSAPPSVQPTVTGGGVASWTEVSGSTVVHQNRRITWFEADTGSTPGSGAITLDFGAVTQDICKWMVVEAQNVADTVQGATVQNGATASVACTFSGAWGTDDNRALLVAWKNSNAAVFTPGTGFTLIPSNTGSNGSMALVYGRDVDLTVDGAWDISGRVMGSAIEVEGTADPAPPAEFEYPRVRRFGLNGRLN